MGFPPRDMPFTYENGKIKFMEGERSFKLHGLGHLTNPFPKAVEDWQAEIWVDILKLHYGMISGIDIEENIQDYMLSQDLLFQLQMF
ncbi:hypothetical protein [Methanococcoides methylutens]|uniref:hypothetical protein n=1 Tax=Methanococcoides methylutens TaxID=2226 RepID=UPI001F1BDEB5|nr:hypothetical protein [Methanococcoides methylutens]